MKLSIIVPVYNCEKYLNKSLDCLVNQTTDDYEIILVNDGSTDSSGDIIREYEQKYPDLIRSMEIDNGGQGRARNFALDIAKGEFIGFADSDDYVALDMYEKMLSAAAAESADIVVCDFYRFDGDNLRYEKAALQDNPLSCAGAVWNKIFSRDILEGIRFPVGLWYEDLEFSAKALFRSNKTVFINEALYYYRNDNVSTMRNANASKNLDMLEVFDHISGFVPEGRGEDYNFLLINHVLLESIKRVDEIGDDSVVEAMRGYVRKKIPDLSKCASYRNETRNRRLIMMLNYLGLDKISMNILKMKA